MTLSQLRFALSVILLGITLCIGQCAAGVIAFSNFDPDLYYNSGGWGVGSVLDIYEFKQAQRFTPATSGKLSKLDLLFDFQQSNALGHNVDELTLTIVADDNGKPGSTELWSQTYRDEATRRRDDPSTSSFNAANGIVLEEGLQYWLVAKTPSAGNTKYIWWYTDTGKNEPRAIYQIRGLVTGQWMVNLNYDDILREFGLRVTVIPEPAAAALMLAAGAALLAMRRRTSLQWTMKAC